MTRNYRKRYNKEKDKDRKERKNPDFIVSIVDSGLRKVGMGWWMYDLKKGTKYLHLRFDSGRFMLLFPTAREQKRLSQC